MKNNFIIEIFRFAGQCKFKMVLSVICSLISVSSGFIPYFGIYKLLVLFFNKSADTQDLLYWCGIIMLGWAGNRLFFGISTCLSHISAYTILENIRLAIAEKLLKAPLGTVLNKPVGSLKSLIVDHVETIELPIAHLIPEGAGYTLVPLGVIIYISSFNWIMAIAALATVPISFLVFTPAMVKLGTKYNDYKQSNTHMNSVIVEYIEGIEVIKAFNQSSESYKKYSNSVSSFLKFTLDWFNSIWKSGVFMMTVLPSTLTFVVPAGMYLYSIGQITPTEFTMCIILSLGLVSPLTGMSDYINALRIIKFAVDDVKELLHIKELSDAKVEKEITNYDITFSNVDFFYETGEKALSNTSLKIPEGSYTALVGASGGGKSTIARMIARFWDVESGEVAIGETNVKDIPLSQLSRIVSYVSQDNFLFNCSLKENIRLGNPKASDDEVYAAAKAAQCDEFIKKLENGYNTTAGEAGNKLSGGEKQRIAIARMMLKNSPVIVLDEATAFTDTENEAKIQAAITELAKGKTLLVIAHRLSTITRADNIILIKNGTVDSQGTFEELLNASPLFNDMWEAHVGGKEWAAKNLTKVKELQYV